MRMDVPEINPAAPLLGDGEDLTSGLAYWYLALPAYMGGTKWRSMGKVTGLDATGTLTNFTFPPSSTSGWSVRHGMRPGGRGCLCFNNGNNRMLFGGTGNLLAAGTPFTLSWWEYINGTAQTFPARFNLLYNAGGSPSAFVVSKTNTTATALAWGVNGSALGFGANTGTVSVTTQQWQHMVLVSTAGPDGLLSSDWTVYKNGIIATVTTPVTIGSATADNRIGRTGANDQVNSALDDVAIWPSRALKPSEARAWYQSSLNGHLAMLQPLSIPWGAFTAAPAGGGVPTFWAQYRRRK